MTLFSAENKSRFFGLLILGAALASCGRYNYNKEVSEADMKERPRIYGDVGGDARQTKNTYPDDPNANKRTSAIRAKLFDKKAQESGKVDTTAALKATQE